jgi:acyl-CoA synthetase (AMP-forming)/AMP-acid ligase II
MEARIVRNDGSGAAVNEPGELWLKGGSIAIGYLNNETMTRKTFIDGWMRTGDYFRVDENGIFSQVHFSFTIYYDQSVLRFSFVERARDLFYVSGQQVSPTEIEDACLNEPGNSRLISDMVVVDVPAAPNSEDKVPRALIVLSEEGKKLGATSVIGELEKWSQGVLSPHQQFLGGIHVIDEVSQVFFRITLADYGGD